MNETPNTASQDRHVVAPSFRDAFRFWLKLGFISFGGPAGQIAIMQSELVEKRKWIEQTHFLHALNFCMLLPGPEAQQLAIYIGWLLHKIRGGIVAGVLFVLPSIFILCALSFIYIAFGNIPWIAAIFYGLKPAVLAIVAVAVIRIGRKALKSAAMWAIAAAAFVAIYFFHIPFPLIIVSAGIIGFIIGKTRNERSTSTPHAFGPTLSLGRALKICALSIFAWWLPIVLAGIFLGTQHTIFREGIFFSKAALVTFGGAYAVLPYVSQQAVETYQWLAPGQMLDGLGLAETTPGPLIMVLQFVGFVGAWNHPGNLPPLLSATLGALITTWVTFAPCFLWIFIGAPYLEKLRDNKLLSATLSTVTAAIVGVILNLAVWFGLHVLFPPNGGIDWFAVAICAAAFIAMLRYKIDIIPVVLASGLLGVIYKLAF
ncbi:MAG: chromate efflux transporter [Spartobacteria bacterium]